MMRFMDPFEEMDRMMSSFSGRAGGGIMPMDAYEHDDVYTLRFDLPGVDPDDVDLTVEGNMLTVTADRASRRSRGSPGSCGSDPPAHTAAMSGSANGSTRATSKQATRMASYRDDPDARGGEATQGLHRRR